MNTTAIPLSRLSLTSRPSLMARLPAFLPTAVLSMTMLAAGTATTIADPAVTRRAFQVEHIKFETTRNFADVQAAFEAGLPKLDPAMIKALAAGDEQRVTELEQGNPLFIFLRRDHGALLQIVGRPRKALQYDVGNPYTASKMTRHRLSAGLYAPLCVILYEDENGDTVFEYDKPSSLFGQFGDDAVTAVARGLDDALESAIRRAME
jgi:uncharacterized protein (DUF302 family)